MKDIIDFQHGHQLALDTIRDNDIFNCALLDNFVCPACSQTHGVHMSLKNETDVDFCLSCLTVFEVLPVFEE